jgi:hypothetical protein
VVEDQCFVFDGRHAPMVSERQGRRGGFEVQGSGCKVQGPQVVNRCLEPWTLHLVPGWVGGNPKFEIRNPK